MNDPASQLALIESLKDNAGYREWYVPALARHLEGLKEAVLEAGITPEERQNRHSGYMAVKEVQSLLSSQEAALYRLLKAVKQPQ
jgi:hypothetical protein